MIDNSDDNVEIEVVDSSKSKKICHRESIKSAQSNGNADEPLVFFRVYTCKSDEERVIDGDPFLIANKGMKTSIYKNIINGVIDSGKEEPIKLLFNPHGMIDIDSNVEYLVLNQSMFDSTVDYLLKTVKSDFIDVKAMPYKRSSIHEANRNTSTLKTIDVEGYSLGQKLLNRLDHAKSVANKETKNKINAITFKNNNEDISVKHLIETNPKDIYLIFEGRSKRVAYQKSTEGIKIKTTSQEIIDFVDNKRTPTKSRRKNIKESHNSSDTQGDDFDVNDGQAASDNNSNSN